MNKIIKIDEDLQNRVSTIPGIQIVLDSDLATLYRINTKILIKP